MRIDFLKKKSKRLGEKIDKLAQRALASEDANEVRSINEQIAEIKEELSEVDEEIRSLEQPENAAPEESRSNVPENATLVNGTTKGSFKSPESRNEDVLESMEYRTAFKAYIQNGTPIPSEVRSGAAVTTKDTEVMIPITIIKKIVDLTTASHGNLYSRVLKTSLPGGVEIPVGSLKASFKWINESTVSPNQNLDKLGKIMFSYHTAEIRIAQTFLESILTLPDFESKIAEVMAEAYLEAMDNGIINGSGSGSMLGIFNDTRVTSQEGHIIEMTAADMSNWKAWRTKLLSKIPKKYKKGAEFVFAPSTVETYLETMSDSNNNPVFKQAAGLEVNDDGDGKFFGRVLTEVEPDVIPDFDTAENGDFVGLLWQPKNYTINENYAYRIRKYYDDNNNEWVDKAMVVVDGKTVDPTGFYIIKKKA